MSNLYDVYLINILVGVLFKKRHRYQTDLKNGTCGITAAGLLFRIFTEEASQELFVCSFCVKFLSRKSL